jgi:hypothetical protein
VNLIPGNYTVTPVKAGYTITPANKQYTPLNANQTNQNFTSKLITYYIKGYVKNTSNAGISGITVTLDGVSDAAYTTGTNGYYEFLNLLPGNYTVTAVKDGYSITPANKQYTPLNANQDNQNFTAVPVYYIKGYVKDASGLALSGVSLSLSGAGTGTYVTKSDGYYEFKNLLSGKYTITPAKTGYIFDPVSKTYSSLTANQSNQNFKSIPVYYIRGYVKNVFGMGASDVTMTLSCGCTTKEYETNSTGYYEFTGLLGGNYTVKASRCFSLFFPFSRSYQNLSCNQDCQDYIGGYFGLFAPKLQGPNTETINICSKDTDVNVLLDYDDNNEDIVSVGSLSFDASMPAIRDAKPTDIGIEIKSDKSLAPQKDFDVVISSFVTSYLGYKSELTLFQYDEANKAWQKIPSKLQGNVLRTTLKSYGKYMIFHAVPANDLNGVRIYPNPYKEGSGDYGGGLINFDGLTRNAKVRVFNVAGELVAEVNKSSNVDKCTWNMRNSSGDKVASGIYIYYIIDSDNSGHVAKGVLAITK